MKLKTLGDYSLVKEIGEGTFGKVYLAKHRFIKKKYVIKVLSKEFSSNQDFIKSFEKYVEVLSTLDHPSIVKVYNISYAESFYFLVMDGAVDSNN
ncbi:protein kinase, partial [bacterium]|nr:protein kinase [bacterium]